MVHINLENYVGVAGVQIRITYDDTLLTAQEAITTPRSDMMPIIDSEIDTGYIQILLFTTSDDTITFVPVFLW